MDDVMVIGTEYQPTMVLGGNCSQKSMSVGDLSGHAHKNKKVLDEITEDKVKEWDNKADKQESIEATSADGVSYTATAKGITELYNGLEIIITPNKANESDAPTLNLNGLGDVIIARPVSVNTAVAVPVDGIRMLAPNAPCRLMYRSVDGSTLWLMADYIKISAEDLRGAVPIEKGGTGATTAEEARENLGITDVESNLKLRDESLQYYDDPDVIPTDTAFFTFETDDENMTATIIGADEELIEAVIPYKYTYDGKEYLVTSIGTRAFYNHINLTNVIFPNTVTHISNASFSGCGFENLTIPGSVKSIREYAFTNCNGEFTLNYSQAGEYTISAMPIINYYMSDTGGGIKVEWVPQTVLKEIECITYTKNADTDPEGKALYDCFFDNDNGTAILFEWGAKYEEPFMIISKDIETAQKTVTGYEEVTELVKVETVIPDEIEPMVTYTTPLVVLNVTDELIFDNVYLDGYNMKIKLKNEEYNQNLDLWIASYTILENGQEMLKEANKVDNVKSDITVGFSGLYDRYKIFCWYDGTMTPAKEPYVFEPYIRKNNI